VQACDRGKSRVGALASPGVRPCIPISPSILGGGHAVADATASFAGGYGVNAIVRNAA
jgi:hypothetical protein